MCLSPQVLLSNAARERCISNIKELPALIFSNAKPKATAAVLLPLCVDNGEVCLLYTLRSSNLKNHSGQVSFPGGKIDNNETVFETALREAEEEIGVKREDVDIWTKMPLHQGRERTTVISPVVGLIRNINMNKLVVNPDEVEEVFSVPVSALCNSEMHGHFEFEKFILPVYQYEKYKVWGITGVITHSFLQCFLPENIYTYNFMKRRYNVNELFSPK